MMYAYGIQLYCCTIRLICNTKFGICCMFEVDPKRGSKETNFAPAAVCRKSSMRSRYSLFSTVIQKSLSFLPLPFCLSKTLIHIGVKPQGFDYFRILGATDPDAFTKKAPGEWKHHPKLLIGYRSVFPQHVHGQSNRSTYTPAVNLQCHGHRLRFTKWEKASFR